MVSLYIKPEFREDDQTKAFEVIESVIFAPMITWTQDGFAISHLVFLLDRHKGDMGTLSSHLAMANDHYKLIREGAYSVVLFTTAQGYISSSWYPAQPTRDSAPTWNYVAVHCHGHPVAMDEFTTTKHISQLVEYLEAHRDNRWHLGELGADGMRSRLEHIMGFEIPIEKIEAKFKMGQDERWRDTEAAIQHLTGSNLPLSSAMKRHNRRDEVE